MGAEHALLALGMVGRWQWLTYAVTSLLYIIPGVTVYYTGVTVWFTGHDFKCAQKSENLSTDAYFPPEIHPGGRHDKYSTCERYANSGNTSNVTETCDSWMFNPYPFEWTAVIEWELVCDKAAYLETAQFVLQLGFSGSVVLATFPDWFGRRRSLLVMQIIMSLFLVAAAFATSPQQLLVLQFFSIALMARGYMTGQVITGELFPKDIRLYTLTFQNVLFHLIVLLWVLLLYLLRDLRKLQLVVACQPLITLPLYRWCPESVRWLAANRRYSEAQMILDKAAEMNKVAPIPPTILRATDATSGRQILNDVHTPTVLGFLRRGRTRRYFFAVLFIIWTNTVVIIGITLLIQLLSDDLFLNFVIFAILGIPGVVGAVCFMH